MDKLDFLMLGLNNWPTLPISEQKHCIPSTESSSLPSSSLKKTKSSYYRTVCLRDNLVDSDVLDQCMVVLGEYIVFHHPQKIINRFTQLVYFCLILSWHQNLIPKFMIIGYRFVFIFVLSLSFWSLKMLHDSLQGLPIYYLTFSPQAFNCTILDGDEATFTTITETNIFRSSSSNHFSYGTSCKFFSNMHLFCI